MCNISDNMHSLSKAICWIDNNTIQKMIQSVYFRHQIIDRRYTGNDIRETGIIFSTENHHETHSDIVSDGRMQNT